MTEFLNALIHCSPKKRTQAAKRAMQQEEAEAETLMDLSTAKPRETGRQS